MQLGALAPPEAIPFDRQVQRGFEVTEVAPDTCRVQTHEKRVYKRSIAVAY